MIWNRTDGSTTPLNTSAASIVPSQATATTTVYQTSTSHEAAVGAGVGVPLGALVLAALGALAFQIRYRRKLERQLARFRTFTAPEAPNVGSAASYAPHELPGVPLVELGTSQKDGK